LAPTIETDPNKVQARMKQIGVGKKTVGYDNYFVAVPKYEIIVIIVIYTSY